MASLKEDCPSGDLLIPEHIRQVKLLANEESLDLLRSHQQVFETASTLRGYTFIERLPVVEGRLMYDVLVYAKNMRFYLVKCHMEPLVIGFDLLSWTRQEAGRKLESYLDQDYGWPPALTSRALDEMNIYLGQALGQTVKDVLRQDTQGVDVVNYNFLDLNSPLWQKLANISVYQRNEVARRFTGLPNGYLSNKALVVEDTTYWLTVMQQFFNEATDVGGG